jgi:hypothetical protein
MQAVRETRSRRLRFPDPFPPAEQTTTMQTTNHDYSQYSPKWQFRFNFYDTHDEPKSPTFKEAMKALPFREKLRLNMNWFAFFFGFIYMFVLGLWRKALVLLGIGLGLGIATFFLPEAAGRAFGLAYSLLVGMTANYAYHLDKVKGSTSWNPFEGIRW